MNPATSTTGARRAPCPTARIAVDLPLATIEEVEHLAALRHLSPQQVLGQIITAALLSDTPHLPTGPDPIERLAHHAHLTHRRSLELAAGRSEP